MAEARRRKELLDRPGAELPEGSIVAVKLAPADLQGPSKKLAPRYSGPCLTLRTFDNGVTYIVVNPESREARQVPISQMKVLVLRDVPDTTAGKELPRWVAPLTGEPSSSSLQAATQASGANGPWLQALNLGEQLPYTQSNGVESQRRESPSLPAQAVEPTPGAEHARDGLRWAFARKAKEVQEVCMDGLAEDAEYLSRRRMI